jgi:hypothetical protein
MMVYVNALEREEVSMASDYMTVVSETIKVVEVVGGTASDEVEYELAVDPHGMAFRRRLGSIEKGDWLRCRHSIRLVREFMAKGGTLGGVWGWGWIVIAPPGGAWRATRH